MIFPSERPVGNVSADRRLFVVFDNEHRAETLLIYFDRTDRTYLNVINGTESRVS